MGKVKELLANTYLEPISKRYGELCSFEVCEDFHIHWRNIRMQFSEEEWTEYCNLVTKSYDNWKLIGSPKPKPDKKLPTYLVQPKNINGVHKINGDNFRIEHDILNGDAIHVHYKSIRLELSFNEFELLANKFCEALSKFKNEKSNDSNTSL